MVPMPRLSCSTSVRSKIAAFAARIAVVSRVTTSSDDAPFSEPRSCVMPRGLVGGVRGAIGVIGVLALIGVLGLFSVWWLVFALPLVLTPPLLQRPPPPKSSSAEDGESAF